jgi:hypothetical protein
MAQQVSGGIPLVRTLAGPLIAAALMGLTMLVLTAIPLVALLVGVAVYGVALVVVERRTSPGDLEVLRGMIQRRFTRSTART